MGAEGVTKNACGQGSDRYGTVFKFNSSEIGKVEVQGACCRMRRITRCGTWERKRLARPKEPPGQTPRRSLQRPSSLVAVSQAEAAVEEPELDRAKHLEPRIRERALVPPPLPRATAARMSSIWFTFE